MRRGQTGMVNGQVVASVIPDRDEPCDFCGTGGCHWTSHPQAHVDVAAWQRQARAEDLA